MFRQGTTTAAVYCTVRPESVDAFFAESERRGARMIAGKCLMDRNAPTALTDTPQRGYDESKALIERWNGQLPTVQSGNGGLLMELPKPQ